MKLGYPAICVKFLDRNKYYDAFDQYHKNKNIVPMSKMFAQYLNERLDILLSYSH